MKARLRYPLFVCCVLALTGTVPSYAAAVAANVYHLGSNEIVVTASPDKSVAMIGEAVTFTLKLENRGPGPVTINPGYSDNLKSASYTPDDLVQVTSNDDKLVGAPIRPPDLGFRGLGGQVIIVAAGDSYSRSYRMSVWANVTEPGTYQVRVRWASHWGGPTSGGLGSGGGTPIVFDASTEIRVEPTDPARIAENIAQPGEAVILRRGTELIVRFDAKPADLAKFGDEKGLTALKFAREGAGPLTYLTERDLSIVLNWPELTTVELGPIPLTDETIAILARVPNLLPDGGLGGQFITRDGFLAMARIPGLTILNLGSFSAPQLTDQELAPFAALRRLNRLSLAPASTDDTLALFRNNRDLETLTIANTQVTDAAMTTVAGFRNLKTLVLRNTSITERGIESLGVMTALTVFHFDKLNDAGMAALARSTNLESLDLGGSPVTDAAVPSIERLKKLFQLGLSDTKVTALPAGLTALRNVFLKGSPINDAGMRPLGDYRKLLSLNLESTQVTDAGLAGLTELTELTHLDLNNTAITNASLEIIAKLPNLTSLSIMNTKVTNAGLAKLSGSKKLLFLRHRGSGVTLTEQQIRQMIPSLYR